MALSSPGCRNLLLPRSRCPLRKGARRRLRRLLQNAQQHSPKIALRPQLALDLRTVFDAASRHEANAKLRSLVDQYHQSAPQLAAWLETNVPESLTVFALPHEHRLRLRTSNLLENLNQQLRRRTRVANVFPNQASLLRLASALLNEISDDWEIAKIYLNMNPASQLPAA